MCTLSLRFLPMCRVKFSPMLHYWSWHSSNSPLLSFLWQQHDRRLQSSSVNTTPTYKQSRTYRKFLFHLSRWWLSLLMHAKKQSYQGQSLSVAHTPPLCSDKTSVATAQCSSALARLHQLITQNGAAHSAKPVTGSMAMAKSGLAVPIRQVFGSLVASADVEHTKHMFGHNIGTKYYCRIQGGLWTIMAAPSQGYFT